METTLQFIGESPMIKKLKKEIPQYAKIQEPLIVKGDPGTGKGILAQLIHAEMPTKGDLITLSPLTTTDADLKKILSNPNGNIAMYLFRDFEGFSFLQQSQIARFLKQLPQKPYIQIVLTTQKAISDARKERKIIEDLFDVIKGYDVVQIPSLLQRQSDIPLLVEYFIKNSCESIGVRLKAIDVNVLDFLVRREWKENVREMKTVIERAVFTSETDNLELPESLVDEYAQLDGIISNINVKQAFSFDRSLYNLEKTLIERVLGLVGENQSKAATILKLSEANLRYRLKKFHIPTSKEKR